MDVGSAVVADEQSFELVEPGEGALDDPAVAAEPGAVLGVTPCDLGFDAASPQLATPARVVVGAIGCDPVWSAPWPADSAADRRHAIDERDQLGAVVAVAARELPGERDAGRVDEEMVLGAVSGSINRARARLGPPFSPARGWRRRPRVTTRSHPPPAAARATARATAPTRPPSATRPSAANTSPQSRSRARAANAATRSPCATQVDELDEVDVIRVSPLDTRKLVPVEAERRRKLRGIAIHHFGAFFHRDWRENDYLWGRLDGAERLLFLVRQELTRLFKTMRYPDGVLGTTLATSQPIEPRGARISDVRSVTTSTRCDHESFRSSRFAARAKARDRALGERALPAFVRPSDAALSLRV